MDIVNTRKHKKHEFISCFYENTSRGKIQIKKQSFQVMPAAYADKFKLIFIIFFYLVKVIFAFIGYAIKSVSFVIFIETFY